MKTRMMIVTIAAWLMMSAQAWAQWVVWDPTNFVQNYVSAIDSVQSNINEATQIANQIRQYQVMLKNSATLTDGEWVSVSSTLNRLADIAKQGQGIAYSMSSLDQTFRERFPSYQPTGDYSASLRGWSATSLDSIRGALASAGAVADQRADESTQFERLTAAAANAVGQKAALDAGNQIAVAQIGQLQELKALVSAQLQAQSAYMAGEVSRKAAIQANVDAFIGRSAPPPARKSFGASGP